MTKQVVVIPDASSACELSHCHFDRREKSAVRRSDDYFDNWQALVIIECRAERTVKSIPHCVRDDKISLVEHRIDRREYALHCHFDRREKSAVRRSDDYSDNRQALVIIEYRAETRVKSIPHCVRDDKIGAGDYRVPCRDTRQAVSSAAVSSAADPSLRDDAKEEPVFTKAQRMLDFCPPTG
jgi:hypothetical protein